MKIENPKKIPEIYLRYLPLFACLGGTWCKIVQDGARCKIKQVSAKKCKILQYHAIPCNTMQYHIIPCSTMQYRAIPCNTMQYHSIICNAMQCRARPCNTMQYHASLIAADGTYHCPVGSIWPFLPSTKGCQLLPPDGTCHNQWLLTKKYGALFDLDSMLYECEDTNAFICR